MELVPHTTIYHTKARRKLPPLGLVLHNTVTQVLPAPHPGGSWHYAVDRDGTGHQYVRDYDYAWHVRACDEWRPPWCVWRDTRVSEPNSCTVGIELVSFAGHPLCDPGYAPYTDAQYQATRELLALLYGRYGPLPVVTHGQLQLDRTDPVALDAARLGLVWHGDGYRFEEATTVEDTTPEEREALRPYFAMYGVEPNMATAIMARACLAHKRDETPGPCLTDEYPATTSDGRPVIRQDFTGRSAEYDPVTGGVSWVELNLLRGQVA